MISAIWWGDHSPKAALETKEDPRFKAKSTNVQKYYGKTSFWQSSQRMVAEKITWKQGTDRLQSLRMEDEKITWKRSPDRWLQTLKRSRQGLRECDWDLNENVPWNEQTGWDRRRLVDEKFCECNDISKAISIRVNRVLMWPEGRIFRETNDLGRRFTILEGSKFRVEWRVKFGGRAAALGNLFSARQLSARARTCTRVRLTFHEINCLNFAFLHLIS